MFKYFNVGRGDDPDQDQSDATEKLTSHKPIEKAQVQAVKEEVERIVTDPKKPRKLTPKQRIMIEELLDANPVRAANTYEKHGPREEFLEKEFSFEQVGSISAYLRGKA